MRERVLHCRGPETEKARLLNFIFVPITTKSPRVDDRNLLELEAEHGVTMDDMYDGEVSEWIWYNHEEEHFERDRALMGGQCKCFSVGVMWTQDWDLLLSEEQCVGPRIEVSVLHAESAVTRHRSKRSPPLSWSWDSERDALYKPIQLIKSIKSSFIQTTSDTKQRGLQEHKKSVNKISKCTETLE